MIKARLNRQHRCKIEKFHDHNMYARFQTDTELSETFIENIVFSAMLTYFSGFPIRYQIFSRQN